MQAAAAALRGEYTCMFCVLTLSLTAAPMAPTREPSSNNPSTFCSSSLQGMDGGLILLSRAMPALSLFWHSWGLNQIAGSSLLASESLQHRTITWHDDWTARRGAEHLLSTAGGCLMKTAVCSVTCTMPAPYEPPVWHCKHRNSIVHHPAAGLCWTGAGR